MAIKYHNAAHHANFWRGRLHRIFLISIMAADAAVLT
jgi:hypothetical protein